MMRMARARRGIADRNAARPCGSVLWITGLPGAGKTTIARRIVRMQRRTHADVVLLDGDALRRVLGERGYGHDVRLRCARRYARLGALLAGQGLHVVVATVSMFAAVRRWN